MAKNEQLIKILAIVGCILGIIGGIMAIASLLAWPIIAGIIIILLAILLLATKGVIPLKKAILPNTWWMVLIVGIVFVVLDYTGWVTWVGGILLIVSALLDKFT